MPHFLYFVISFRRHLPSPLSLGQIRSRPPTSSPIRSTSKCLCHFCFSSVQLLPVALPTHHFWYVCVCFWAGSDMHQGLRRKASTYFCMREISVCYGVSLRWSSALCDIFSSQRKCITSINVNGSYVHESRGYAPISLSSTSIAMTKLL